MARYKIIYLLLLTYIVYVSSEEAEDRTISLKPPDKLILQKSSPYQPSFFSKIKNWFFPPSDTVPAEGHHNAPQYLPPQSHSYQRKPGCDPCNNAPWIPIASNIGHKTLINFVPPSSHIEDFKPPPSQYGPPPSFQNRPSLTPQYGPPPIQQYSKPLPPPIRYNSPPSNQYGPPPNKQYIPLQETPQQYAPPPSNQYSSQTPPTLYGPPPALYVRPPPPSHYNPPIFKPKPEKINFGLPQNLKPPPITHLKPVSSAYEVPLNVNLPNFKTTYQSLPPTSPSTNFYLHPPPPPPSDSYGAPVSSFNADYQIRQEYLPPVEQLPLPSNPIPLPNLSGNPLPPIHNPGNFHDSISQQGAYYEVRANPNVQVLPSVKVADYLASIEHPINVIQSPLVEVSVKDTSSEITEPHSDVRPDGYYENSGKLSENPIIVEDTHTAASAVNVTYHNTNQNDLREDPQTSYQTSNLDISNSELLKEVLLKQDGTEKNKTLTPSTLDYSNWQPSWSSSSISSSVVPPPYRPTTWLQPDPSTTKKPKQIQVIIPYVNNNKPIPFENSGRMVPSKPYSTLLPVYTPPSQSEEVWSKFVDDFNLAESKKVTATAFSSPTTQVYNIRDLLKNTKEYYNNDKLPFDVISLQNNIDDWTQQEFSKNLPRDQKSNTNGFVSSKKIPNEYFTTPLNTETTTENFDHEQASSNKKETKSEEDFETNLIFRETTTEVSTTTKNSSSWDGTKVTVSPLTKEKVYIVTPQPRDFRTTTPKSAWSHPPQVHNVTQTVLPTPKFLIRVDPENNDSRQRLKEDSGPVTVVFSEWPHLINNLQTTTTAKPTSKHPLLGLMDLSSYTPPPNSTVETILGHSRVVTVVTPSSVTRKSTKVK